MPVERGRRLTSDREDPAPDLPALFEAIDWAVGAAFGPKRPALVCEPGRAMVAEAFDLALQVRTRDGEAPFLNDGIHGGLSEWRDLGPAARISALAPDGEARRGPHRAMSVFGPTCDSPDRLSDRVALPADLAEGDYLLLHACGAYSTALSTRFNGYGARRIVALAP